MNVMIGVSVGLEAAPGATQRATQREVEMLAVPGSGRDIPLYRAMVIPARSVRYVLCTNVVHMWKG